MPQAKDKMCEIDEHISKRFDIHKRLGKGAYGIVWKAVDRKTKEVVAVKKIFDAFRNQTDAQRTFREIMFLQSFKNHPNIIKLHSIHRAANNRDIYLGFEYMETDLHNVIKRGNVLKDVHKRYIMYQLLKATKYIHSGNVIHRDQKPSNILLDTLCRCKIADFGLARSLTQMLDGNDTDPTLTDYVATRWYRAPEILIANRRYTKGIDMWSLGCILGEMIAGKPIFPGSSTVNQIEKIMATIPTPSQDDISNVCVSGIGTSMIKNASNVHKVPLKAMLGPDVPFDGLDLIHKLLFFNPSKRLTAQQALKHPYVSKFHDPDQEIDMPCTVTIPFNDDIRLSVDDYRNKLYEIMAEHTKLKPLKVQRNLVKVQPDFKYDVKPRVAKDTERFLKSRCNSTYVTQSEPKLHQTKPKNPVYIKSEPKIPARQAVPPNHQIKSETKKYGQPLHSKTSSHLKRRSLEPKANNIYMSFNSFNQTHGIITQSALMELRASGMR
ncbi:PREDICTED: putative serine/threonine-protein kinase C05D10.2 [Nicrophorus vespilloides]|uniref:Serine/threonine-protein kinase C05D10.2 n=1 Tax=Nicrophorus vespilloides TaxID=110193 RepID=A0ABM1MBK0_NICVS|nr:PREDICTED: putative serine/threonine-protein kinase C05D10.2 [Nicrophorus vespilloides]